MRQVVGPFVVAAALAALPSPVAACTCAIVRSANATPEPVLSLAERAASRGAAFVGTVLALRNPTSPMTEKQEPLRPQEVLFQVDRAWKGVTRDTITLLVGPEAPCATYLSGVRYLVLADSRDGAPRTARCDVALQMRPGPIQNATSALGPPSYIQPLVGSRMIDRGMIRVGEAPPLAEPEIPVTLSFYGEERPIRARIADRVLEPRYGMFRTDLPPGAYRVLLQWSGDESESVDVVLRCEERPPDYDRCSVHRMLGWARQAGSER